MLYASRRDHPDAQRGDGNPALHRHARRNGEGDRSEDRDNPHVAYLQK